MRLLLSFQVGARLVTDPGEAISLLDHFDVPWDHDAGIEDASDTAAPNDWWVEVDVAGLDGRYLHYEQPGPDGPRVTAEIPR